MIEENVSINQSLVSCMLVHVKSSKQCINGHKTPGSIECRDPGHPKKSLAHKQNEPITTCVVYLTIDNDSNISAVMGE